MERSTSLKVKKKAMSLLYLWLSGRKLKRAEGNNCPGWNLKVCAFSQAAHIHEGHRDQAINKGLMLRAMPKAPPRYGVWCVCMWVHTCGVCIFSLISTRWLELIPCPSKFPWFLLLLFWYRWDFSCYSKMI